jgi:hypothetical protein
VSSHLAPSRRDRTLTGLVQVRSNVTRRQGSAREMCGKRVRAEWPVRPVVFTIGLAAFQRTVDLSSKELS